MVDLEKLRAVADELGGAHAFEVEAAAKDGHAAGMARALEALSGAGLLGWCVPANSGGHDAGELAAQDEVSVRALGALRSALAYQSGWLDVAFVMQGLGSYSLARAGSEALRAEVLPGVISGESIAAFALTEPEAGSSLTQASTRARASGDVWRLDGHKTYISNAGLARFYTLLARTSGEPTDARAGDDFTMFYVPADSPGLEVRPFEVIAPHPIGEVVLEGVEIPDAYRLGDVGQGLGVALATLARFRTSVAAAANGFARRALDESVRHLDERRQFGKPLSAFQGLRFDIAEMDTRLRAGELLVDEAARLVDTGEEAQAAVARAKLFSTETASWICDRAVQHFGGRGVRRGEIVERLFREVRALRIYEGTSEIQKLILAKSVFERARS